MKYKYLAICTLLASLAVAVGYFASRDRIRIQAEADAAYGLALEELKGSSQEEIENKLGTPAATFFHPGDSPVVASRTSFLIYHGIPVKHRFGSHEPHDLLICCQSGKTVWVVASYRSEQGPSSTP